MSHRLPKLLTLCALALFASIAWSDSAEAQIAFQNNVTGRPYGGGVSTRQRVLSNPSVSPYLSLLDGSNTAGVPSYFTRVRPQMEARQRSFQTQNQLRSLQSQVGNLGTQLQQRGQNGEITTGHPTRFMNYLQYYPQLNQR